MEKLNIEQLEIEQAKQEMEILKQSIQAGKDLEKLRKTPEFKRLFDGMFIKLGGDILWQNIRNLTEEQMKGRGSEKNLEVIKMMEGQIKSRVDFQGFLDTVENDYLNAVAEQEEQERGEVIK